MFHSLSSPHSFCTCSICARASARGLQPPSWNLTRASHAVAPSSFSSLGPSIYSLHIWVHFFLLLKIPPVSYIALLILGLITQDFFRVFFSFVPNKIPLQLFNLFQLGDEAEVCILSHPLEAPVTHPESVLPKFTEFPYLPHQVDISPFTSC